MRTLLSHNNGYLVGLTSHFKPLLECTDDQETEVPNHLLVNIGQVYSVLRRLKTTKSPGPDGIPNRILKTFAFEFSPVIMDIYNTSVVQGVFPDRLKRSIVVPIPKVSPPQTIEDDLRPISLTAQVSKVMEGFGCRKWVINWTQSNLLFRESQPLRHSSISST